MATLITDARAGQVGVSVKFSAARSPVRVGRRMM